MNKIVMILVFMFALTRVNAQDTDNTNKKRNQFGITLGYVGATAKATLEDSSISGTNSQGGVSLGLSLKSMISEKIYLQPSVQYAYIDDESYLFIPLMLKYYIDDKFNIMAGPQGTFSFEDTQGLPINTFGLDLSFGAGYDFNDHFYIEARYAFELTNRTSKGIDESYFLDYGFDPIIDNRRIDITTKLNTFHITLGYRFN